MLNVDTGVPNIDLSPVSPSPKTIAIRREYDGAFVRRMECIQGSMSRGHVRRHVLAGGGRGWKGSGGRVSGGRRGRG